MLKGIIHHQMSINMKVSWNRGTPKSSILVGFPLLTIHFWGIPYFQVPIINHNPIYGIYNPIYNQL